MAINTGLGFNVAGKEPIDSRITVADMAARKALLSGQAYEGLIVYQQDTDVLYVLTNDADPSLDASWMEIGAGVTIDGDGNSITIGGTTTEIPVVTGGSASGNTLTLTRNGTSNADLSITGLTETSIDADGNTVTINSTDTEIPVITGGSASGDTLTITRNGSAADLSLTGLTETSIDADGNTITINSTDTEIPVVTGGSASGGTLTLNRNGSAADLSISGLEDGSVETSSSFTTDDGTVGELLFYTGTDAPGLYRRAANTGNEDDWILIANIDSEIGVVGTSATLPNTVGRPVGELFHKTGTDAGIYRRIANTNTASDNWVLIADLDTDTTYTLTEDANEFLSDGTTANPNYQTLELRDDDSNIISNIPLGANQITATAGENGSALVELARDNGFLTNPVHEMRVNMAHEFHGAVTASTNPEYMEWASPPSAGGALELNTQGLITRFDDTYRKREIENWVEHDIPVSSKQAIQYYEVQGRPNRDENAPAGALSSEIIEFSEFEVDLALQRRTGVVSDYHTKAISFSLDSSQATDNIGHWTIAPGVRGTIFVIKDGVYKEFQLVDTETGRSPDQLLFSIAFDHLGDLIGSHDDHYIRVGAEQGVMFNFKLSELNGDPNVGIGVRKSTTHFKNEAITAISVQYHVDGSNHNTQTIAFGTSEGHISYISNRINANGLLAADYITDYFNTDDVTVFGNPIFPTGVQYPGINYVIASYPANTAKNNVLVKDIKWTGPREFIAVGDHQPSTVNGGIGSGIPNDVLGAPLIAYFRNIRALEGGNLVDGQIHYLTTPFREEFFDNVFSVLVGESDEKPVSFEATEGDGSNLTALNQLFRTRLTSVVPITVGTDSWVYLFGAREDHTAGASEFNRAFCLKATVTGGKSITEALDAFDNSGTSIQGGINWYLVDEISEITGYFGAGNNNLGPINNAQVRHEVRGGGSVIPDNKIIDIFGERRLAAFHNATTDTFTYTQGAEDGLDHASNGWATTDVIWGGWVGNALASDTSNPLDGFQTLTIMGQSGNGGTTPLYGISKYAADITVTLKPINAAGTSTDPSIVLGPIRVPDAQGELLITNLLNPLAAAFNAPATGVLPNAPANEVATVSAFDAIYGVATISFSSDTRDFDMSVTTPDIHQIVNKDKDDYEFILRFSQEFIAGEGQEIFVLSHPRLRDPNGNILSPDDQVTLLTSSTDNTPLDKSLYDILFTVDGLELQINPTGTSDGLPFGTLVQVTYGYNTPAFYQFVHSIATSIVVHDPYHGGSGTIHVPVGMAFADDDALVDYLVEKLTDVFAATNIDVLQEGDSSVIEFRSTLRGDQIGDLILDDDQKIMITVTSPSTNQNLENVGRLQINRLFNGDTDFPGKFASTFDFDNALTETDLRSVLHQVFANVGSVGGLNVPVTTAVGDETSVINSANESLYEDNRIITESRIAEQVVSTHIASTGTAAFDGDVDFLNGTAIDATGTDWDFTGGTVTGLTTLLNLATAGSSNNDKVTTQGYVDTAISGIDTDLVVLHTGGLGAGESVVVPRGHWLIFTADRPYLLYNATNGTHTTTSSGGVLVGELLSLLQTTGNPLTLVESNLPNALPAEATDVDYRLRVGADGSITWIVDFDNLPNGPTVGTGSTAIPAETHVDYALRRSADADGAETLSWEVITDSNLPEGPTTDIPNNTHVDYSLRRTDVNGTESLSWEVATDIGITEEEANALIVTNNSWTEDRRNLYVAGSVVSDFEVITDSGTGMTIGFSAREYVRRTTANPASPDVVTRPSEDTYVWNEATQSYEGTYWLAVIFAGERWRPFQEYLERDVIEYEGLDNVPRQAFCQVSHTSSTATNPAVVGATIFDVRGHDATHPWEPVGASIDVSTQSSVANIQPFTQSAGGSDHNILVLASGTGTNERAGQWFVDLTRADDTTEGAQIGNLTIPLGTGIAFGQSSNTAHELQFAETVDPDDDGNDRSRLWFAFADGATQVIPAEVVFEAQIFLTTARVDYGQVTRFVFDQDQFNIATSDPHVGHAAVSVNIPDPTIEIFEGAQLGDAVFFEVGAQGYSFENANRSFLEQDGSGTIDIYSAVIGTGGDAGELVITLGSNDTGNLDSSLDPLLTPIRLNSSVADPTASDLFGFSDSATFDSSTETTYAFSKKGTATIIGGDFDGFVATTYHFTYAGSSIPTEISGASDVVNIFTIAGAPVSLGESGKLYFNDNDFILDYDNGDTYIAADINLAGSTRDIFSPTETYVRGDLVSYAVNEEWNTYVKLEDGANNGFPNVDTTNWSPVGGGIDIEVFRGATAPISGTPGADGASGLVPQPLIADAGRFLRGDGDWVSIPFDTFIGATAGAAGVGGTLPAPPAGSQNNYLSGSGNWVSPTFSQASLWIETATYATGDLVVFVDTNDSRGRYQAYTSRVDANVGNQPIDGGVLNANWQDTGGLGSQILVNGAVVSQPNLISSTRTLPSTQIGVEVIAGFGGVRNVDYFVDFTDKTLGVHGFESDERTPTDNTTPIDFFSPVAFRETIGGTGVDAAIDAQVTGTATGQLGIEAGANNYIPVEGPGITIDQATNTFSAASVFGAGDITIPSIEGAVTRTGPITDIDDFVDNATSTTNWTNELRPASRVENSIDTDDDGSIAFLDNGDNPITTFAAVTKIVINQPSSEAGAAVGNFNPVFQRVEVGSSIVLLRTDLNGNVDPDVWAVFTVEPNTFNAGFLNISGSETEVLVSHLSSHIQFATGFSIGDRIVAITNTEFFDGTAFSRYASDTNALIEEGAFDLLQSGITSTGSAVSVNVPMNHADPNTMAYLAIQFNAGIPTEITSSNVASTTTLYTIDGSPVTIASMVNGETLDFDNNVYLAYQSRYDGAPEAFLDVITITAFGATTVTYRRIFDAANIVPQN